MNTFKFLTLVTLFIGFTSCSNDDDSTPVLEIESETVSNLQATQTADYSTTVSYTHLTLPTTPYV